jgi:lipopolysaccharide biosynthesis glycosyltransferase
MKKYAYVMILYGNSIYFIGALVTGWSLKRVTDLNNHDIIIMCTPDVPLLQKKILEKIYTRIIDIDYAKVQASAEGRFKDIFTKLKCLELEEYEKIVLMDVDMCVVQSLDDIFLLNAPAGSLTNSGFEPEIKHGDKIPVNRIMKDNGKIRSINAGLLLLAPDKKEYKNIINDLESHPEKLSYEMPEQEYLSRRWYNKWTNVSFYYNYQFGLSRRIHKNKLNEYNKIKCYHYSSSFKPWFALSEGVDFVKKNALEKKHSWYPYNLWINEYENVKEKIINKYL